MRTIVLAFVGFTGVAQAQAATDVWRMVKTSDATCHELPDPASPVGNRYRIGSVVHSVKQLNGAGGRLWYSDAGQTRGSKLCWIDGGATIPYDWRNPAPAHAAVADSLLARPGLTFRDVAELIARFEIRDPYATNARSLAESFPLVAYKRLVLVDTAASMIRGAPHPYDQVWIAAHQDMLRYNEPQGMYHVPPSVVRRLIDANPGAAWADDATWTAATGDLGGDECSPSCYLDYIVRGPAVYWTRYPAGKHINEALAMGDRLMAGAFATLSEGAPGKAEIEEVRATLTKVSPPLRKKLLSRLDSLGRVKPTGVR